MTRIQAQKLPGLKVLIAEHMPQAFYAGRGYSFTATIENQASGFDLVTIPLAAEDLRAATRTFCGLSRTKVSRFTDFSPALPGARTLTQFFNCE